MVRLRLALFSLGLALPVSAAAFAGQHRTLVVDLGSSIALPQLVSNAIAAFLVLIILLVTVLFLLGAFYVVMSHGKEDLVQKGKDLMIQSLIGLAVVLGAYGIIRTAFYLLYAA